MYKGEIVTQNFSHEELIELFKNINIPGNRKKIIVNNLKLAHAVAKQFVNLYPDLGEQIHECSYIGLIKAVDSYDFKKNYKFTTYATRCITNEIGMFLRKERKLRNKTFSFEDVIVRDKDGEDLISFSEILLYEDKNFDNIINRELYTYLWKCINELPKREQEIILLHFGFVGEKPHRQREIVKKMGYSQSYVSRLIKGSLKKIKEQLLLYDDEIEKTCIQHLR